jgi:hypothetical protein
MVGVKLLRKYSPVFGNYVFYSDIRFNCAVESFAVAVLCKEREKRVYVVCREDALSILLKCSETRSGGLIFQAENFFLLMKT